MKQFLRDVAKLFSPKQHHIQEEIARSKQSIEDAKKVLKQFKAHLDREDFWFTCECSEKPKEKINAPCVRSFSNSTSSNHAA